MKLNSYCVLLILVISFVFFSCHKDDQDNIKPKVKILQPIDGDTINLDQLSVFIGEFSDNMSLSSYFVQIHNPNINDKSRVVLNNDTTITGDSVIYLNQIIQKSSIFNVDTTIVVNDEFRIDTVASYNSRIYHVKEGLYQFKVVVMDKAGNKDSSSININIAYPPNPY